MATTRLVEAARGNVRKARRGRADRAFARRAGTREGIPGRSRTSKWDLVEAIRRLR